MKMSDNSQTNAVPTLSVVMTVYNGAQFITEAVRSVIDQTFRDFEFIIVDDGSTDETGIILNSLRDDRIILLRNEKSVGQTSALNSAIRRARGRYIARLDADDICKLNRFKCQVEFMERHPDVVIVGSSAMRVAPNGRHLGIWRVPMSDFDIRFTSLLTPPFIHPTVMFRREAIMTVGGYNEDLAMAQDYELWTRLLQHGHGRNLKACLLYYRQHDKAGTHRRRATQLKLHEVGMRAAQSSVLPDWSCSGTDIHILRKFLVGHTPEDTTSHAEWLKCMRLLFHLINFFFKTYPTAQFDTHTATSIIRLLGKACFRYGDASAICATVWKLLKFRWYSPFVLFRDFLSSMNYRMRRRLFSGT